MGQQRRGQHQQTSDDGGHLSFAQQRQLEAEAVRKRRQASVPLYDIPPVVLDLDAEGSRHVRPYDEAMETAETARWRGAHASIDELTERLAAFAEESEAADARLTAVALGLTPWRVSDRDIWSAVLGEGMGTRRGEEQKQEQTNGSNGSVMRRLLYENGVSDRIAADPAKTVRFLLQRQAMAAREGRDESRSLPLDSVKGFSAALARCSSFIEVRRLLTLASHSSSRGCQVVAHEGGTIAARLVSLTTSSSPDASTTTLVMLLNLSHRFQAEDVGLGAPLCSLGLQAAAAALEPAAMQRFLDIGLARDYYRSRASAAVVQAALSTVCAELHRRRARQRQAGDGSLADLFLVLVSFRTAVLAAASATTDAISLSSASQPSREAYLAVLAELGAVRTLWQELRLCSSGIDIASADMLTTAVLRYAEYTAGEPDSRLVDGSADVEDGRRLRLLDRQMLRAYEETTEARAREAKGGGETAVQRGARSKQFQTDVIEAFSRTTAQEAMDSIQAIVWKVSPV